MQVRSVKPASSPRPFEFASLLTSSPGRHIVITTLPDGLSSHEPLLILAHSLKPALDVKGPIFFQITPGKI